ncbi:MAG: non-hydrolyzing UDP-N-acetylglucosamine 2-epimerase [Candidatus Helarchaeota archaeon]
MKFFSVVGTRPNFIKEFLVNRECKKRDIQEILVHTGQHYDYEMSQVFFEDFDLPQPDYFLDQKNDNILAFTGNSIIQLGNLLRKKRPDFVLSYGDVNSTLAAAIASTKLGIPFAHVEGGIRSVDLYNPEEVNRRVSDVLAEVIYCCTRTDFNNLKREGYEPHRIVLSGDLMKDALFHTLEHNDIKIYKGDYMVLTLHRQENVLNSERLETILDGLIRSKKRIIFPAHPRTLKQIEHFGLIKKLASSNIEVLKPLSYVKFIQLAAGAEKILTDSGGVRREAYLLKKPCIVLIELSWFLEISQAGWNVLTAPHSEHIAYLINNFKPKKEHPEIFGDGKAHIKIINDLEERFGK